MVSNKGFGLLLGRFKRVFAVLLPLCVLALPVSAEEEGLAKATFAGGCFWCMEKPFDVLEGVKSTTSGYIGGHKHKPTYRQVSAGSTGHTEAIQIIYDPKLVSYKELLAVFWRNIDPFDARGQFCDKGDQYRPEIFYYGKAQQEEAIESLKALKEGELKSALADGARVQVDITKASQFFAAEDYHQDYYKKNPVRYHYYRYRCGRDERLKQVWGGEAK